VIGKDKKGIGWVWKGEKKVVGKVEFRLAGLMQNVLYRNRNVRLQLLNFAPHLKQRLIYFHPKLIVSFSQVWLLVCKVW